MALYTVKSGDNLTKIAQQYGIGIENITGYRSGNPNLIFPGETLTINTQPVAPVQPSPQPVQQPQPPQNAPGSPTPQVTPAPVAQLSPVPQPAPQPIQQQAQQPATGLGSAQYTQQLLASTPGQSVRQQSAQPVQPIAPVQPIQPPAPVQSPKLTTEEIIQDYLNRPDSQTSPSATFEDIYNKVSEKLNLASDKAGIETSAKEIEKLKIELGDKIAEINSNPWLSEGKRQKSVSLIQEKYQGREDALINRLRLQESVYNRNAENARFAATQAFDFVQQQQTGERQQAQLEQNQFQFLIEQAQKAQEAKRKLGERDEVVEEVFEGGVLRKKIFDKNTGKVIADLGVSKIPKAGTDQKVEQQGIDSLARRLNADQIEVSNIPEKDRINVLARAKEFARTDLKDDITQFKQGGKKSKDYIKQLTKAYPEFSKEEIEREIGPVQEETKKVETSFFQRLFGGFSGK